MTDKEVSTLIKILKAHYPYWYKDVTMDEAKLIIEVWKRQFKDIDYELMEKVVYKWGETKEKPPSIAELKGSIFGLHDEYSRRYSELMKDKNARPEEIERIRRLKNQAWSCMNASRR